jgi:hypothetical protein
MGFTSSFLQVFFAIVLVIIFLIIGFAIYNFEMLKAIQKSRAVQLTTPIFTGVVDFNTTGTYTYNTISSSPLDTSYRNLGNAINQPAGAEFTYNFWLYIDPQSTSFFKSTPTKNSKNTYTADYGLDTDQFILFMRGDTKVVEYNSLCGTTKKSDVLVKCPLVKLENTGDVLTVEFNTVQTKDANGVFRGSDAIMQNARNTCDAISTDWNFVNSYKIGVKNIKASYPAQWFMVSIIIMDTYPSDPLPIRNKVRCQIYINGSIQMDTYVDGMFNPPTSAGNSVLLQNQGNLYVGPKITFKRPGTQTELSTVPPGNATATGTGQTAGTPAVAINNPRSLCMADLTYMNYVPTPEQMTALYNAGFTKTYALGPGTATNVPGQIDVQKQFMSALSKNTNPDVVSQIYTGNK